MLQRTSLQEFGFATCANPLRVRRPLLIPSVLASRIAHALLNFAMAEANQLERLAGIETGIAQGAHASDENQPVKLDRPA